MLTGIRLVDEPTQISQSVPEDRYRRNLKQDIKVAVDKFLDFKEELDRLHPNCAVFIEKLMQENIRRY